MTLATVDRYDPTHLISGFGKSTLSAGGLLVDSGDRTHVGPETEVTE